MPAERFGLDTNVLVYTAGADIPDRRERATLVVSQAAATGRCVLATQNIVEFVNAVSRPRRKGGPPLLSRGAAVLRARELMLLFPGLARPDESALLVALAEAEVGRASWWDAALAATLALAGCTVLLGEDMQDGGKVAGVTILDPFAGDELPAAVTELLGAPA